MKSHETVLTLLLFQLPQVSSPRMACALDKKKTKQKETGVSLFCCASTLQQVPVGFISDLV